ncbi:DNA-directed RNA polymerase subunit alpha [Candidatus Wolfebacteria bacterium]|uniref:DNA-directed RNA polymerase subunit alpha n=1 Tax=Candidatus Wolfebacteria bacterium CG_4_10_14_0_2_um_filter_39_18 TaxID=1975061 RepID=A0A2M7THU1_9BACT|nr:DNA-directed RNA polymerase subunit alpha [Candidatus Wolfebacteria bacterium]NCO44452.1 DNA-directed RNA polymerase subunit alpha [Candidatus Wolfebacteria bacterium]PIZ45426.1 MAG: DNA-directed RNA polymerase subunit alpha [Candidatus Wolfebacteria bacterium CG_4_10_14_0_2_um_filter_39_18]
MEYARLSDTVKIKKISETDKEGVFEVEGLYTGYGLTLGNSLRRVLLSSLPGAAITQIKIKGAEHEFSTLPGILEDIIEITLNLKKVRFHFYASEPQILALRVKGEKEVTAADIKANAQVEIVNPEAHIATLTNKNAELEIEITVDKGAGYVPAEARKTEKLPIKTIAVDTIFSPVVKVNFSVENMRVGDRTDFNKLKLVIETDGSIYPSSALRKASNILKDHFGKVAEIEVMEDERESVAAETKSEKIEKKEKKTKKKK